MTSSPCHVQDGQTSFEAFLSQGVDPVTSFGASSPIQSNMHATFDFDPTAPSPYGALGKTPTVRLRGSANEMFLVSPLDRRPAAFRSRMVSGAGHHHQASPLRFRKANENENIHVVDPDDPSPWDDVDGDDAISSRPLRYGLTVVEDRSPYASPVKILRPASAAPLGAPIAITPSKTKSPKMSSAPSTLRGKKRSAPGLGSPSVRKSPNRPRRPTLDNDHAPTSPLARGRNSSATSLTGAPPGARNLSSSSFLAPSFRQDRNTSGSTVMTASTCFEVVSPHLTPYSNSDYATVPLQPLPELIGSHNSPQLSQGPSPVCTTPQPGGVFYTSPNPAFEPVRDTSLMSGVAQVMRGARAGSVPNSTPMSSVATFPNAQGMYRQHTLGTISEAPNMIEDSQVPYSQPTRPAVASRPQFRSVEYPAVPGVTLAQSLPSGTSPVDVAAWSAQTFNLGGGYYQPAPAVQRHASGSYIYQHQPDGRMPPQGAAARSASASFQSTIPSMTDMPISLTAGGLFGPAPSASLLPQSHVESSAMARQASDMEGYETEVLSVTSLQTPRKRKNHPRVGNPLRPGPRPRPKTPRKGDSVSVGMLSPESGSVDVGVFTSSQPMPLGHGQVSMQRTMSNDMFPSSQQSSAPQPQLFIQPPSNDADQQAAGLPKEFLEKLYTIFMTTDGSATGQPVKRFKCLIDGCDRHFPRKSAIHSHIQTHLEDKPFRCEVAGCDAAFVRQHDLRRHLRIHSGTKPFPCPCGKGFARGDALHRHRQRGICSGSIVPRRESQSPPPESESN